MGLGVGPGLAGYARESAKRAASRRVPAASEPRRAAGERRFLRLCFSYGFSVGWQSAALYQRGENAVSGKQPRARPMVSGVGKARLAAGGDAGAAALERLRHPAQGALRGTGQA